MNSITGTEAITLMRELRHDENKYFIMQHLTFNSVNQSSDGLRIVERCRLRPSLPKEIFRTESDLLLPYTDLEQKKPGMCYKKLIRFVAFPPDFELLKVTWFPENL